MNKYFIPLILILSITVKSFSQNIDSLVFFDYKIIPHQYQYKGTKVEEISGIEYSGTPEKYYLLPQSDFAPHYFLCTIEEHSNQISWYLDSVINLNAQNFDGESVRFNKKDKSIYLSEELKKQSFIKKTNSSGNLKTILQSDSMQKFNRGWEGICFDTDYNNLFISLEQSYNRPITDILKFNLSTGKIDTFKYKLDVLPNDTKNDNGITEILCINDSTLIVLERDWQKSTKHTSVRVYKTEINYKTKKTVKTKCLFNFDNLYFKPDNVEGMTFNADRSKIIFVTDDNKSKHQQTQIICFTIK